MGCSLLGSSWYMLILRDNEQSVATGWSEATRTRTSTSSCSRSHQLLRTGWKFVFTRQGRSHFHILRQFGTLLLVKTNVEGKFCTDVPFGSCFPCAKRLDAYSRKKSPW